MKCDGNYCWTYARTCSGPGCSDLLRTLRTFVCLGLYTCPGPIEVPEAPERPQRGPKIQNLEVRCSQS